MIRYIDDKKENGILYDYKKIRSDYKKLKTPQGFFNPCTLPLERCKWNVLLSERASGKTTNLILLGMLFNKNYGTVIQYVRQKEEMTTPKTHRAIMEVIIASGYIEKITDGRYNTAIYKAKRWYYAKVNDLQEIEEQSSEHFMMVLSIDKNDIYKSSYNAPTGDFIIFDEFISRYYYQDEFITFCDLLSTIIRKRKSAHIFLLANTINKHSQYFNELGIYETIQTMQKGSNIVHTTPIGTNIYIELIEIGERLTTAKTIVNALYFGFKNPLLTAITGVGDWSIKNYQHIPKNEKREILSRNHYIFFNERYVNLEIAKDDKLGMVILCHWASTIYDDSVVYTIKDIVDSRHRFKVGYSDLDKLIWQLYARNKFYYATNDVGDFVSAYVKSAQKL